MNIFDSLTIRFGERGIAQKIYMYSLPTLHDDLKKDISSFYFTWKSILNEYILSNEVDHILDIKKHNKTSIK